MSEPRLSGLRVFLAGKLVGGDGSWGRYIYCSAVLCSQAIETAAVMRCLGASQRRILSISIFRLVRVALTASLVGGFLGYAGQSFLSVLAEEKLGFPLAPPSLWPLLTGMLIGLITALGFGLAHCSSSPLSQYWDPAGRRRRPPPSMWLTFGLAFHQRWTDLLASR
ncbi:MAG: hypothetical protein CM1200mP18_17630 [Gammaproteobacteria bacterium]|nr:MAG: hypothetical protein CM1200mP18_17630 [Gammaproteobacteria bacterium]